MKLRSVLLFPFLQNISPKLLPQRGLKKIEDNLWESTDYDPQFLLKGVLLKFLSGWITVEVHIESDNEISPKLYLDFGEGYSESRVVYMMPIDEGFFKAELMLPKVPVGIRFDPTDDIALFSITECRIKIHSEIIHLGHQLMYIMKKDIQKAQDPFRIFKKSYARYKKHGYIGMLNRLEKEYTLLSSKVILKNINDQNKNYQLWMKQNEKYHKESYLKLLNYKPLISVIVPVFNTSEKYLKECIESVLEQSYQNFELCIVDDASSDLKTLKVLNAYLEHPKIKIVFRKKNGQISAATNSALKIASGEYLTFLNHDDMLAKNALYEVVKSINTNKNVKLIYSDEDKIDNDGNRYAPHFKSSWNPDMFFSQNYISHLHVIPANLVREIEGLRVGYEDAQDYDLLLRVIATIENSNEIIHIEKILYHKRGIKSMVKQNSTHKVGFKALEDYFNKKSEAVVVIEDGLLLNTYKVNYPIPMKPPLVTLLIPTRDGYDILYKCVESILEKTIYPNYEIIILDNETSCIKTLKYFEEIKKYHNIRILEYHYPFNYSAINNFGVKHAKGEIIGLINNDIEVISESWLSEMVSHAVRPEIGAVGAMLYYDNETIQHAGVIGTFGGAGHSHKHFKRGSNGYFGRLKIIQNYSAVTGACLVVEKKLYEEVGGLEEENLKIAFNDVDFCFKLLSKGYRNLWTPYVELYHHESISRGKDDNEEKIKRAQREVAYLRSKWIKYIEEDSYYNNNLTNKDEKFSLKINE